MSLKRGEIILTAPGREHRTLICIFWQYPNVIPKGRFKYLLPSPTVGPSLLLRVSWSSTELLAGTMNRGVMSPPCQVQTYSRFGTSLWDFSLIDTDSADISRGLSLTSSHFGPPLPLCCSFKPRVMNLNLSVCFVLDTQCGVGGSILR